MIWAERVDEVEWPDRMVHLLVFRGRYRLTRSIGMTIDVWQERAGLALLPLRPGSGPSRYRVLGLVSHQLRDQSSSNGQRGVRLTVRFLELILAPRYDLSNRLDLH